MKKVLSIVCIVCLLLLSISFSGCADNNSNKMVYVSNYGKIHKNPNCSGMIYYEIMSYHDAIGNGYVECQNCY